MPRFLRAFLIILVGVLVLTACRGRPAPTPVPATIAPASVAPASVAPATVVPATSRTAVLTATPAREPATPSLPTGWEEHRTTDFTVYLPPGWTVEGRGLDDAEARFAALQQENPLLAGIIGGADVLEEAALWAFAPVAEGATFVDNLNIRRTPLAGQQVTDMRTVVAPIVEQYERLNFANVAARSDLRINGRPAAYITYRYPFVGRDGAPVEVSGHQYLIATDADLWILSYAAGPDNPADSAQGFAQSAQSFSADL